MLLLIYVGVVAVLPSRLDLESLYYMPVTPHGASNGLIPVYDNDICQSLMIVLWQILLYVNLKPKNRKKTMGSVPCKTIIWTNSGLMNETLIVTIGMCSEGGIMQWLIDARQCFYQQTVCWCTETEISLWWYFHHWLHLTESSHIWQLSMEPMMKTW